MVTKFKRRQKPNAGDRRESRMIEVDSRAVVSPSAQNRNEREDRRLRCSRRRSRTGRRLHPRSSRRGPGTIARSAKANHVYPFASVGGDPQDLTFKGERVTLEVGDHNEFREFSTVNRGTVKGGGTTRVGSHNLFMSYAQSRTIASRRSHDLRQRRNARWTCRRRRLRAVGAFCPVHQFCRIGKYSYIAAHTVITQDVPPFSKVVAPRGTHCYGVNTVGLERRGFPPSASKRLRRRSGCCCVPSSTLRRPSRRFVKPAGLG